MMDIAGENMGRKIFLDPIFQGEKMFFTVSIAPKDKETG